MKWILFLLLTSCFHTAKEKPAEPAREAPKKEAPGWVTNEKILEARRYCRGPNGGVDKVAADPSNVFYCKNGMKGFIAKKEVKSEQRKSKNN